MRLHTNATSTEKSQSGVELSAAAQEHTRPRYWKLALVFVLALIFAATAKAQLPDQGPAQGTTETTGKSTGNYTIQQSIELGYRDSMINGNISNYNMIENYGSGWRLFDYDLDMRSVNHTGLFFDNLSFHNFGYGGDPNSVSRLRINKNKWYDFRVMFRRDENFFDYNLLANPLNPTNFPTGCGGATPCTPVAVTNSPHALYMDRRMQDYDLTLLPESRVQFRVGYSNVFSGGPGFTTIHEGAESLLSTDVRNTTNSYRFGVDYKGLPRTTISFDELLTYARVDNITTDNNFQYQLANGTPVDLGVDFQGTTPCAKPVTNNTTTPPTVTPTCNGTLSYGLIGNPRASFPTERVSFQSNYFKNLEMSGSVAYSSGSNTIADLNELFNGWVSRSVTRVSTTAGPADAKRVLANANWSGDYQITKKLSIVDEFVYDNWRIPSSWQTLETNLFGTLPGAGQAGMTLPISPATPANFSTVCPAPFTAASCPQHTSSSGADMTNEIVQQFLAQDIRNNLVELKYDITNRISAHLGYFYEARTISDFTATFDTSEIYLPGGATGAAGNDFLAARGDCALVGGVLPAACIQSADGSIAEGTASNPVPEAANDSGRNLYYIHENALVVGVSARLLDSLRLNGEAMVGSNDNSFTRISPRNLQSYKVHATYRPKAWASVDGAVDIHENRDNAFTVNNIEHGRTYSFNTTLAPYATLWIDFGYSYMDIYTQTEICFADTGSTTFTQACPVVNNGGGGLGTLSMYASKDHYAYADVMWKPYKRVTATLGYMGSIVRGNTTMLNPLDPTGTLDVNYLKPYVSLAIDLYKGITYKTSWNYYGYNDHGIVNPLGLAALPSQNFDGNNVTFSLRYAF